MAEVQHPKFQRQVDEFAVLDRHDQVDLLSALVLEFCWEDNIDADPCFAQIRAHLELPGNHDFQACFDQDRWTVVTTDTAEASQ